MYTSDSHLDFFGSSFNHSFYIYEMHCISPIKQFEDISETR